MTQLINRFANSYSSFQSLRFVDSGNSLNFSISVKEETLNNRMKSNKMTCHY